MSSRTALITGADGAIASHVTEAFAQAGWSLALVAGNKAGRARLAQQYPDACTLVADLDHDEDARRVANAAIDACGEIDALLNIAGGFAMSPATETTPAQLDAQLDINLRTAFNATRAILPHMLHIGHGFILGVGAAQAINGGASCGAYAAAKAAMIAWMKSMHAELAPRGIAMAIVYAMGAVDTAGNRKAMPEVDPSTWIDPAELAATMLHLAMRGSRGQIREVHIYPPPRRPRRPGAAVT